MVKLRLLETIDRHFDFEVSTAWGGDREASGPATNNPIPAVASDNTYYVPLGALGLCLKSLGVLPLIHTGLQPGD